jgi:hypothetical protein
MGFEHRFQITGQAVGRPQNVQERLGFNAPEGLMLLYLCLKFPHHLPVSPACVLSRKFAETIPLRADLGSRVPSLRSELVTFWEGAPHLPQLADWDLGTRRTTPR